MIFVLTVPSSICSTVPRAYLVFIYHCICPLFLGGSDDWAKGGAGIKYSYTIELPDTGRHGFLLPSHKAKGAGEEAMALTEAMILNMN